MEVTRHPPFFQHYAPDMLYMVSFPITFPLLSLPHPRMMTRVHLARVRLVWRYHTILVDG